MKVHRRFTQLAQLSLVLAVFLAPPLSVVAWACAYYPCAFCSDIDTCAPSKWCGWGPPRQKILCYDYHPGGNIGGSQLCCCWSYAGGCNPPPTGPCLKCFVKGEASHAQYKTCYDLNPCLPNLFDEVSNCSSGSGGGGG